MVVIGNQKVILVIGRISNNLKFIVKESNSLSRRVSSLSHVSSEVTTSHFR